MRNTGRDVPKERRVEILNEMKKKMRRSGYSDKMCMNVIESGLEGYYKMLENEIRGVRKINRPQYEDRLKRETDKVTEKEDWHTKTKDREKTSQNNWGGGT